jgi:hypothetical protein
VRDTGVSAVDKRHRPRVTMPTGAWRCGTTGVPSWRRSPIRRVAPRGADRRTRDRSQRTSASQSIWIRMRHTPRSSSSGGGLASRTRPGCELVVGATSPRFRTIHNHLPRLCSEGRHSFWRVQVLGSGWWLFSSCHVATALSLETLKQDRCHRRFWLFDARIRAPLVAWAAVAAQAPLKPGARRGHR